MSYKDPKELFVKLLSDVRQHEEGLTGTLNTLKEKVEDKDTKEYFDSLIYLSGKNLDTIDLCFKYIGEQPVKTEDKLKDLFLEDFRREFNQMDSPVVKLLYFSAKVNHLMNVRKGEWVTLIAMSEIAGNRGVSVLLESCLAQKVAFSERIRRRIRNLIEEEID